MIIAYYGSPAKMNLSRSTHVHCFNMFQLCLGGGGGFALGRITLKVSNDVGLASWPVPWENWEKENMAAKKRTTYVGVTCSNIKSELAIIIFHISRLE